MDIGKGRVTLNNCWATCKDISGLFIYGNVGTTKCNIENTLCVCRCEISIPVGGKNCQRIKNENFSLYRIDIENPTNKPSRFPTRKPSINPTNKPSRFPTMKPSINPTYNPSRIPTGQPSLYPSLFPTYKEISYYTKIDSSAECLTMDIGKGKTTLNNCWATCKDLSGLFIYGNIGTTECNIENTLCSCRCEISIPVGGKNCHRIDNEYFSLYRIETEEPTKNPTEESNKILPQTYSIKKSTESPTDNNDSINHHTVTIVGICAGTILVVFVIGMIYYNRRHIYQENMRQFELVRFHRNNRTVPVSNNERNRMINTPIQGISLEESIPISNNRIDKSII